MKKAPESSGRADGNLLVLSGDSGNSCGNEAGKNTGDGSCMNVGESSSKVGNVQDPGDRVSIAGSWLRGLSADIDVLIDKLGKPMLLNASLNVVNIGVGPPGLFDICIFA